MLKAERVNEILRDCLFTDAELEDGSLPEGQETVIANGILRKFGFHPERLRGHADEVKALLEELPDEFHKDKGGGWSFLNACMDKHGNHWAEHPTMDELFSLGQGLGMVKETVPRERWEILPGGMPYYIIDTSEVNITTTVLQT